MALGNLQAPSDCSHGASFCDPPSVYGQLANGPAMCAIGIGGSLAAPPLPHHRAYGSVHGGSTDLSRGRSRHGGESEPVEEVIGERVGERGAVAEPPWTVSTAGGVRRQLLAHAKTV